MSSNSMKVKARYGTPNLNMTLTNTGNWLLWANMTDPTRFGTRLRRASKKQVNKAAKYLKKEIKRSMKNSARFEPSSNLTKLLKRSGRLGIVNRPLRMTGDLVNKKLKTKLMKTSKTEYGAFIGFLSGERAGRNNQLSSARLARILHDGRAIPVTDKMRRFFMALSISTRTRTGTMLIHPLRSDKNYIRIKARPYLDSVMRSRSVQRNVQQILSEIVKDSFNPTKSGTN